MDILARPRANENSWLWLAKIITGVLIFALLILHLIVNHLVARGGLLTYADVLAYYANPIIPVLEGLFLVFVVTHAMLGVRGILLDLHPRGAVIRGIDVALTSIGIVAIGYGVWLLRTIAERAGG